MSTDPASTPERELAELVAVRNASAVSEVYDRHAPMVHAYCAELCTPELVTEATLAAFVDFLGRAQRGDAQQGADRLLQRAARTAAATRLRAADGRSSACRAVPDMLAARANGELTRNDEALTAHLSDCSACRSVADSLVTAEDAFQRRLQADLPAELREQWLEVASAERPRTPDPETVKQPDEEPEVPASDVVKEPEAPASEADLPGAPPPVLPAPVRARRGGLVGAARRVVASRRR